MIPGQNFHEKSLKYRKLLFADVEQTYYMYPTVKNERFFFEKKKGIQGEEIQEEIR